MVATRVKSSVARSRRSRCRRSFWLPRNWTLSLLSQRISLLTYTHVVLTLTSYSFMQLASSA
jgi:hypothetical protein